LPQYYTLPVGVRCRIEWHADNNRWFITGTYQ